MSWGWSSARGRVLSLAGIGVLSWVIPPDLVDEAVGDGLAWEMRLRALPARLGVYFILGLCLFSHEPYGQVLRELTAGLEGRLSAAGWRVPASTALTRVRARIGEKPLESLFRRLCTPAAAAPRSPWSHVCGLLAVAWDGTTIAVPGSPENAAAFGLPGVAKGKGTGKGPGQPPGTEPGRPSGEPEGPDTVAGTAYPLLRLVTLVACGTRALLDAAAGPGRGKGTGERAMAASLLGSLRPGMLLLADRNFYSWQLWHAAAATGADLLWRVKSSAHLPVAAELPDGSFLTRITAPRTAAFRNRKNERRRRAGMPPDTSPLPAVTVRVIEYTLTVTADDGTTRTERYRLITTLTDWRACPALDLADGYARRWAIETGYREFKTYLRGPGRVLRARTPELARQELWAYLAIYQAIRTLITRAAATAGTDPGRISFTTTLHAARRTITTARTSMHTTLTATETEILASPVPRRDGRVYPRAVSKPTAPYPSRHNHTSPISQHATHTTTITTPNTTTRTTSHQHQHPQKPPNNPP